MLLRIFITMLGLSACFPVFCSSSENSWLNKEYQPSDFTQKSTTALMQAAENGHLLALQWLIEQGADINHRAEGRLSTLDYAIQSGQSGAVKLLLHAGARVTNTALQDASRQGSLDVVMALLKRQTYDESALTKALGQAVLNGHAGLVAPLIEAGADPNGKVEILNNEEPILTLVRFENDATTLRELLNFNVDAHVTTPTHGDSLFMNAAIDNSVPMMKMLLDHGVDPNWINARGESALSRMFSLNQTKALPFLLEHGIDVNVPVKGEPLLSIFIARKKHEFARKILPRANVNQVDGAHQTPLMVAIEADAGDIVEAILLKKPDFSLRNAYGKSALDMALEKKNKALVKRMIEYGAPVDAGVLKTAIEAGDKGIFAHLLAHGGDLQTKIMDTIRERRGNYINIKNRLVSMARYACSKKQQAIGIFLITQGVHYELESLAGCAVENGLETMLDLLQKKHKNFVKTPHIGDPLMVIASYSGQSKMLSWLIKHGGHVNAQDRFGSSALSLAMQSRDPAAVSMLIKHGARLRSRQNTEYGSGISTLMVASEYGYSDIVQRLLKAGADIHRKTLFGESALHFAARSNDSRIFQQLHQKGADLNAQSLEHVTPLMLAAEHTDAGKILDYLLSHGADLNRIDLYGHNALFYAVKKPQWRNAKRLIEAGIDVNQTDLTGKTVRDYINSGYGDDYDAVEKSLDSAGLVPKVKKTTALANDLKEISEAEVKKLLHQDDFAAHVLLGRYFEGVKHDRVNAWYWFRKSAVEGHPAAQYHLGRLLLQGLGGAELDHEGIFWLKKAAQSKYGPALYFLYEYYSKKNKKDRAGTFLMQAVEAGEPAALYKKAMQPELLGQADLSNKEILRLVKTAAEKSYAAAQYTLAVYLLAEGEDQDPAAAVGWLKSAVAQNHLEAMLLLAESFSEGKGVEKDEKQALVWYKKARSLGADIDRIFGLLHEHGTGMPVEKDKARTFYLRSRLNGDILARSALGGLHENGLDAGPDYKTALRWYRLSAQQDNAAYAYLRVAMLYLDKSKLGYKPAVARYYLEPPAKVEVPEAQYQLSLLYRQGKGVKKDAEKAEFWLNKAVENGYQQNAND